MPDKKYCPSCSQPLTEGNYCEHCDAEFTISQKDGARVKKQGKIKSIDERLSKVEKAVFPDPEPEPDDPEPDDPGPDDPEPDGDVFPE